MKNYKVENFYHKNQFVISDGENTIFQSYNSICAMYDGNTLTLGRDWDYSNTTIRHLYQFLSEYVGLDNLNTKVIRKSIENGKIDTLATCLTTREAVDFLRAFYRGMDFIYLINNNND